MGRALLRRASAGKPVMRTAAQPRQRHLVLDSDAAQAKAAREAAATARIDPHWTPAERERRAAHYEAEARRFEERAR